jgi:predicted metalloprotease with PDZ domain
MYEGVIEYFSQLLLMETNPDYLAYFLKTIAWNSRDAKKHFSMTKMSENIYKTRWSKKYNTVYTKGALTAFALDIEIYTLTDGKMRLYDVMMALKRRYKDKYFSDNELIDEIIEIVGDSKISTFFKRYVSGRSALPLKKYLNQIGCEIKIIKEETDDLWNGFNNRISYKGTRVFIKRPSKELYGKLKCGRKIEVISINGKKNVYANRFKLFDLKEGEYIEYLCDGKTKKIIIKSENRKRKYLLRKVLKVKESNAKQKELFKEITKSEW